jgi:glycosyltransferase involved in cell wall biosynthesis
MIMHVLVIPYNYPTVEFPQRAIFIADQVKALRSSGNKVSVLGCIPKTINDVIKTKKFIFGQIKNQPWLISTPAIRGLLNINDFLSFNVGKWLFKNYLKRVGTPDIIHVHNSSTAKLALWIKESYEIPFVVTEHSSAMWQGKNVFNKQIFTESKANIAVSEVFAKSLSQRYSVPFTDIPNVVDTEFFVPSKKMKTNNTVKICSIGNLTKNKNHTLLIQSVDTLVKKGHEIELIIAGSGSELSSLKREIVSLSLVGKVKLLGLQTRREVLDLLQSSDYFVLPSIKETFGVVLIEALSCGLPILTLNNGGSKSIVNEKVGMIANNQQEFRASLLNLMSKDYDRKEIRRYAIEHYSSSIIANKLLKVYLE